MSRFGRRHRVHAKLETVIVRKGQAQWLSLSMRRRSEQMEASLREEDPRAGLADVLLTLDEDDNESA